MISGPGFQNGFRVRFFGDGVSTAAVRGFRSRTNANRILRDEGSMTESELYKELGTLTKHKDQWEASIPYVLSLLNSDSVKIQAKALWLLGEMGLAFPHSLRSGVSQVASFRNSAEPLLRERAVNALGRIGRSDFALVEPYWADLFRFARDNEAKVRLSFIWASENIASNTPGPYGPFVPVFAELLRDGDDKVRMEAPEMFRVLGKRRPEFVAPYLDLLRAISETDGNRVVRIHCLGAIRAATSDPARHPANGGTRS